MDCFQDFCLACDKQSSGSGPYCSQACRLADLERANTSAPTSPTSPSSPSHSRLSWSSANSTSASAYVLQPAYDFHSPSQQERPQTSYFMRSHAPQDTEQPTASQQRSLTPSSSRTSLSSTTSNASTTSAAGGLSEEARLALQGYFNSFRSTKGAKRRPSLR